MNDLLLEIEEKDALLSQYDRERQQLQAEIHNQVATHIFAYCFQYSLYECIIREFICKANRLSLVV